MIILYSSTKTKPEKFVEQKTSDSSSPPNNSMASFSQPLAFFSSQSQPIKKSPTFKNSKIASSISEPSPSSQENSPESQPSEVDPIKLALAKAKAYKNSKQFNPPTPNTTQEPFATVTGKIGDGSIADGDVTKEVPLALKLALEKANEYKKNKTLEQTENSGPKKGGNEEFLGNNQSIKNPVKNKGELSVSSIDFMGLGFSDKRIGRGLPAGLVPQSDPFPEGELPEVEILVGDMVTSRLDDVLTASNKIPVDENDTDVYKPKVSTWGVFPRPSNISKTYGGGKTIRPGEALETADERAAKEARTKQLVTAYKSKIGLNIDPKVKSECEKALNNGDLLMDLGKLNEALPFYEKVMEKLTFQSELHGLAALQWSICQDSLSRPNEARVMYEKLQSHPSPKVSKRARQFAFGFQAMEMMKVRSFSSSQLNTDYQNYFDAFVQDRKNYPSKEAEADEGGLNQALPYIIFLVSPIFMVLLIAASKSQ
ncbi:hypothetical protein PHJA_001388200 [Phtheirospermum japonicum]|uniref:Uncharacterized protein n=1 Tax=Phtheirospermum japonicum TaxID=374723 RepID=A0A830BY96_9LAMI|nr:hypothetical protein PHJA_001388200 [Phtheirospermum japonicum]